jgi:hypothetical protein
MTQFIIDFGLLVVLFATAIAIGVLLNVWGRR